MTYAAVDTLDFRAIAKEMVGTRVRSTDVRSLSSRRSDGSELPPAEVSARFERTGQNTFESANALGATVDREGLNNLYAVMPQAYFASFPSAEEARRYALQGLMAALFVTSLIMTAVAVS